MTALALLAEIEARIDWELDEGEKRTAQAALDDLSVDARYYTGMQLDTSNCPELVKSLILRAAERHLRNPEGASQSRAGDETLMWDSKKDARAGSAHFAEEEIDALRSVNSADGDMGLAFGTFGTYAWTNKKAPRDLTVGTDPGTEPFPFISRDDEVYW